MCLEYGQLLLDFSKLEPSELVHCTALEEAMRPLTRVLQDKRTPEEALHADWL
jgi:hypothetical protein